MTEDKMKSIDFKQIDLCMKMLPILENHIGLYSNDRPHDFDQDKFFRESPVGQLIVDLSAVMMEFLNEILIEHNVGSVEKHNIQ